MTTYYLVQPGSRPREMIGSYVLAGDGIYGILEAFGMRTPVPLALCEVRGLPPLFPWFGGALVPGDDNPEVDASEAPLPFVPTYHLLTEANPRLPFIDPGRVYQYVLARQGVFLLAQCTGLRCLIPISQRVELPGLAPARPFVVPEYPPVDAQIVQQILENARAARDKEFDQPIEQLYYLLWEQGRWRLVIPVQDATSTSVRARAITPEYERAFIEGHSHQGFRAKFSDGDYIAEVKYGAFRVYFVLGSIFTQPEMRVRLVVHGYECEVFASTFFQLPEGIRDGVAHEWGIPT
jgi:hypothetical protein